MKRRSFIRSGIKLVFLNFFRPLSPKYHIRFAVASDGHFGQEDTDYITWHHEMVGWFNKEFEKNSLDFVVVNGDIVNHPSYLDHAKKFFQKLKMPFYINMGNSDKTNQETWKETWGLDQNYTFLVKDILFLVANTSNEKGEYLCADHEWIKNILKSNTEKKYIFAFLHIPQKKWSEPCVECPEVIQILLSTQNLIAIFHGHDHSMDGVIKLNDKFFCFDGHLGGKWGKDYRGYRIVEIYDDYSVLTYQYNPLEDRIENYHVLKS